MIQGFVEVHRDSRRTIYEKRLPIGCLVIVHVTSSGTLLGNHYHAKKDEHFFVLKGGGTVFLQMVNTKGQFLESVHKQTLKSLSYLEVCRYMGHAFRLKKGSVLLCFATRKYDQGDDHRHVLV